MKRVLLIACVLLSGTAHAEVPKPVPLAEMLQNRLAKTDELTALKMLPALREVRKSWVESYEGWKERQEAPEPTSTTTSWGTQIGPFAIPTYIVMCESGGNYDAENPTSSASGAYQLIDSTFLGTAAGAASGFTHASDAPPHIQDAAAAEVWNGGAGASAWAACL